MLKFVRKNRSFLQAADIQFPYLILQRNIKGRQECAYVIRGSVSKPSFPLIDILVSAIASIFAATERTAVKVVKLIKNDSNNQYYYPAKSENDFAVQFLSTFLFEKSMKSILQIHHDWQIKLPRYFPG